MQSFAFSRSSRYWYRQSLSCVQLRRRFSKPWHDEVLRVLSAKLGTIPSRSDVVRFALEAYLGVDLSETEVDGRRTAPAKARQR